MERATVGREAIERRAAGDASFVTNPDGTRTYNKASVAAYRNGLRVGVLVWWKAFLPMCKIMVVDLYFAILAIGMYIVVLFRGGVVTTYSVIICANASLLYGRSERREGRRTPLSAPLTGTPVSHRRTIGYLLDCTLCTF